MKRFLVTTGLVLLALILLVAGFITAVATTSWGQNFVTQQVNSYLGKKIKAPFHIGRVSYRIPDWIELEDVFFKTPQGDTLLLGERMRVDIDMMALLQNKISLNQIELDKVSLHVTRTLPDTAFNFNYIIDAFNTAKPDTASLATKIAPPPDTTSTPLDISLSGITLRKTLIRYEDDVAGANVNAYVDSIRVNFSEVNVARSRYLIRDVAADGLSVKTRLYEGIPTPSTPSKPGDTLTLGLGKWQLTHALWDIRVETADFATTGNVAKLAMESDYFHLNGEKVGLKSLAMANANITTTLLRPQRVQQEGRSPSAVAAIKQADPTLKAAVKAEEKAQAAQPSGWVARVGSVKFSNNRIRFDDQTQPNQPRGLDYGHLDLNGLGIEGRNLLYSPDRISGQIRQGKFKDKSGFVLQHFDVDLLYGEKATLLTNLFIRTPNTILRDRLELRYDSLGQLTRATEGKNLNRVKVLLNLRQSKLAFSDVLQLAPFLADTPPLAGNRNEVVRADARLQGTLADLRIPKAEFAMFSGTILKASGRLTNVTNPDKLGLDLTLTDARTNRADIRKLVPPGTLPDSLALAPELKLTGKIRGTLNNLVTDAKLATNWGTASFDGTLRNFYAGKNQAYTGKAVLAKFEAGKWLMNPKQFGTITAQAAVNGRGIDPATMQTNFRAVVAEAGLNGYSYKNADVTGALVNGLLTLKGGIDDPNVRLKLDTKVGLKTAYPTIAGDINIQELNLDKLKLYADPLSIKGNIRLAMTSTDPVRPEGTIYANDAVVSLKGKTYPIDTLYLKAETVSPNRKSLMVGLPFGQLALRGQFEYTQLYDIVASEISRYVKLPDLAYKAVKPPYSFYVTGQVRQHPLLQAFVPALRKLEPVSLDAYLDNTGSADRRDTTFSARIKTGLVDYDTIVVNGSSLNLLAYNNQLNVAGQLNSLQTNSLKIGLTQLSGSAANNRFSFSVVNKDSVNKDRYGLAGLVSVIGSNYRLQVGQRGLLTNYRTWTSDTTGYLEYGPRGVLAQNFMLKQGVQTISLNSVEPVPNGPLRVEARNVSLSDLSGLADQDTTLVAGTLNSTVVVRDYLSASNGTPLSFTGDLKVDSLRVMDKPIGNLNGDFANASGGRIGVNVTLLSATNDAKVSGYYDPTNPKEALDFYLKLNKLDAKTIEAFSFGELRRARGMLRGETDIQGSTNNPRLNGGISFDSVAFNIKQLNATYRIDQERIRLSGQTLTFTDFNLRDTLGRTLTTDGRVELSNIPDVAYDLRVRAQNFLALNAARKDNDFFYGKAAISANLHIVGKGASPAVTGNVKLEEGSQVTTVLPSDEASLNDARQVVTFINHNDTLALSKYLRPRKDSVLAPLQFDQLNNSNINLTLEADDKSEITIVVDELNGDNLKARGNANLAVNVSPGGEISVLGRYEVTEGRYSLTYQVLQREFEIQKGGYINFTGDPLKADLNLTAVYEARTTSDALISSESTNATQSTTKVNLPYNVALTLSGNLAAPTITFDIIAPRETLSRLGSSADLVSQKLTSLREDPNQLNKQVFGLLILGNFIAETSGGSSSEFNVGNTAESLARSSVSKIISQQLQQFASGLIKGVDLDVGLNSRSGTAETGGTAGTNRTDLNIGLSRSFLQGRLTVSVGKNFLVDGSQDVKAAQNNNAVFDNLNLNYNLTRDGRYALRAYRRSNTERTILEGFVIETGVGFVITVDFNTLADLVRRRKEEDVE